MARTMTFLDSRRTAVIVVAGPTASGKSALALDLAAQLDGCVINADSMQVYNDLHLLTARPSASDIAHVPHSLYGMLPGSEVCSAGRWLDMAAAEITACRASGTVPILCGGTGLYLKAMLEGLSPIPPIHPEVRMAARSLMVKLGNEAFHAELAKLDPVAAKRLNVGDTQRLVRAFEVMEGTGRPIGDWQNEPAVRAIEADFFTILVEPQRDILYSRCDQRFDQMMDYGALEEARTLLYENLPADAPVMKVLGVPELRSHLIDDVPLAEAIAKAKQSTRNFAKRQGTWFKGQLRADLTIPTQYSESLRIEIFTIVRRFLLTGVE